MSTSLTQTNESLAADWLAQSRILAKNKDRKKALDLVNKSIKFHPTDEAYATKSIIVRNMGDLKGAKTAAEKALKLNPHNLFAQYNLLKALDPRLQQDGTLNKFKDIASSRANTSDDMKAIAFSLEVLGRDIEIVPLYKSAIESPAFDLDPFLLCDLACILMDNGLKPEAMFREVLRLEPRFTVALHNLAIILDEQKRYLEAEATLIEELKFAPKDTDALLQMIYVLCNDGRPEEAIKFAKGLPSKNAEAHSAKAIIQKTIAYKQDTYKAQKKYFEEALKEYKAALKLEPDNIEYLCGKGQMLKALNKDAEGNAVIQQAFALYQNEEVREEQSSGDNSFDKKFVESIFTTAIPGFVPTPDIAPELPAGLVGFDWSEILGLPNPDHSSHSTDHSGSPSSRSGDDYHHNSSGDECHHGTFIGAGGYSAAAVWG